MGKFTEKIEVFIYLLYVLASSDAILEDNFLLIGDGLGGHIWQMSKDGQNLHLLLDDRDESPVGLDYDPVNAKVYWTDINNARINRMNLDGSDREVVLQLTPASIPEGVAVDPVAKLVFYTDNGRDTINVVKTDGTDHRIIVTSAKNPRSIRIDPTFSRIYWTDWGLGTIESALYDGRQRSVVINSTQEAWLNGLVLDITEQKLYWTDAKASTLMTATVEGKDQHAILNGDITITNRNNTQQKVHLYGIALGKDNLFFSDWASRAVYHSNHDGSAIEAMGPSNFSTPNTVILYESSSYILGAESACKEKNGGCSNLCVPVPGNIVCMCPDYRRLGDDRKTCTSVVQANGPDVIWLEHDGHETSYIKGIKGEPEDYLRTKEIKTWSIRSPAWHWTAIDMDYKKNLIYMADKQDRFIVQMSLNGTLDIKVVYHGTSSAVSGVAIDWVAGNLYWTDALYNWVAVTKAEDRSIAHRTLVDTGLDEPHGIAVWPQKGLMFWTDWGSVPKIEVANLDGENRRILWTRNLNKPKGIAIDYGSNRIFWCSKTSINSISFDGTTASDFQFHGGYSGVNFVDISLHLDYIFAVDTAMPRLWFYDRRKEATEGVHMLLQRDPLGVAMYESRRQTNVTSQCGSLKCEHLCISMGEGVSKCMCADGHKLNSDEKTCSEDTSLLHSPSYIYSIGDRLCAVTTKASLSLVSNPNDLCFYESKDEHEFRALAYNYASGEVYFSEVKHRVRSIRRAHMVAKENNTAIVQGVGIVNGIAVDWLSENIYWTDSTYNHIWTARTDGSYQRIVTSDVKTPHGIAVDFMRKKLYWSEQDINGTDQAIKSTGLDGDGIQILYGNPGGRPGGMTIDYVQNRLFWVDIKSKTVESIDLDDFSHKFHPYVRNEDNIKDIYDIAIFQDYMVLTERAPNNVSGIRILEKETGNEVSSGIMHQNHNEAFGVIAFTKPYQQAAGSAGCELDNGGCEQLCVETTISYKCVCVEGYVMNNDGKTCRTATQLNNNFFLLADDYRYHIYQTDSSMQTISAIKTPSTDRPIALDYDFREDRVYWSDFRENVVKRSFLNGSDSVIIKFKEEGSRIDGLAFEYHSRLLYFTDTGRHEIGVMNPTGILRKVLVQGEQNVYNPRAIVLDSANGHMYYTLRQTNKGRIQRRDMDGNNPHTLVSTTLSWPTGLALDLNERKMYWCDAHSERVETANLLGQNRETLLNLNIQGDPFGLAVQGSFIYWTDWNFRGIHRSKRNGQNSVIIHDDFFSGLNDVKFFNRSLIPDTTPCTVDNGGCSHFCLPVPENQRTCECPDSYDGQAQLTTDGRNCGRVDTCDEGIPNGQWNAICQKLVGGSCQFSCNNGFGVTTTRDITCGRDRKWMADLPALCTDRTCPLLPTPSNATVDPRCPILVGPGAQCFHSCKDGYAQIGGDQIRNCGKNLQWTGDPIICASVPTCPPLPNPTNVVSSPTNCASKVHEVGTVCIHSCQDGTSRYPGVGQVQRTCTKTGQWTGSDILCMIGGTPSNPQPVPATTDDSGLQIPILAGVVAGIIVLLALIIGIACFLWRRRLAKSPSRSPYTETINGLQGTSPLSYDVHRDRVVMGGRSDAYDNPVYESHADMQNYTNEAAAGISPNNNMDYHTKGAEAPPLPPKRPITDEEIAVKLHDETIDRTAFENPMFGLNNGHVKVQSEPDDTVPQD